MRGTPTDNRTSKRERSSSLEMPTSRLRTSSPLYQDKKDQSIGQEIPTWSSDSYLGSIRDKDDMEDDKMSDWAVIMQDEERQENLSSIFLRLNKEDEAWDGEEGEWEEGEHRIGEDRIIRQKASKSEEEDEVAPGRAEAKITNELVNLMQEMLQKALKEAVDPLKAEIAK